MSSENVGFHSTVTVFNLSVCLSIRLSIYVFVCRDHIQTQQIHNPGDIHRGVHLSLCVINRFFETSKILTLN